MCILEIIKVSIAESTEGSILAEDVFGLNGTLLVVKDTVINGYIISRLAEMGVESVRLYKQEIYNESGGQAYLLFADTYAETVKGVREALHELVAGKPAALAKIVSLTEKILHCPVQAEIVAKCLQDIRDADEYTYTHSVNTAFYSMMIGKWMKLPDGEVRKLVEASLLHDIGKLRIPGDILNKHGILTRDEYEIIKQHTVIGYGIVSDYEEIDTQVKMAVLLHHERVDQSGYPFNAPPECISGYAKMIAVADVFDAMTSDRVYKKRATPFEAFEMFVTVGVGIFDTTVMNAFLRNLSTYYVGANVLLNNGDRGEIVYVPPQDITCPIVRTGTGFLDLSREEGLKIKSML